MPNVKKMIGDKPYRKTPGTTFIPLKTRKKTEQRQMNVESGIELSHVFMQVYSGGLVVLARLSGSRSLSLFAFLSELAYTDGTFVKNEKFFTLLDKFTDLHGFELFTERNVRDCFLSMKREGIIKNERGSTYTVNPLYIWGNNSKFRPEAVMKFYKNAEKSLEDDLQNTVMVAGQTLEKSIEKDGMYVKVTAKYDEYFDDEDEGIINV